MHRRRFSKTPRPPLRHSPPEGSQESGNAHHVAKSQTDDAACSPPRRDRRQALRVRDAPIARAVPHSSHSPILPVLTSTNLRACTLPDTCKPTALAETTGVSQNAREKGNVAGRTRCGRDRVDRYLRPLRARPGGSISTAGLRSGPIGLDSKDPLRVRLIQGVRSARGPIPEGPVGLSTFSESLRFLRQLCLLISEGRTHSFMGDQGPLPPRFCEYHPRVPPLLRLSVLRIHPASSSYPRFSLIPPPPHPDLLLSCPSFTLAC